MKVRNWLRLEKSTLLGTFKTFGYPLISLWFEIVDHGVFRSFGYSLVDGMIL